MANKIRLGFVGANVRSNWATEGHFPAIKACPDVELTAVCTTNAASAEEARHAFGARLAFSDFRKMVLSTEIDAVVVCVRVPSHYEPTMAALEAGKHVYTEWALGRNTSEAEEMTALARSKGLQTAVGLQSRVTPALLYVKELIETGYVGDVLACNVTTVRRQALSLPSSKRYLADVNSGANPLTKQSAHVIDALRFVAGDICQLGCMITTRLKQWEETDTRKTVDVTAPDTVMLNGQLASGAVVSAHVGVVPWAPSGYRMEIYGRDGTLVVSGRASSQRDVLRLQGAQGSQELRDLVIPEERFTYVPQGFPRGTPFHVGQMYSLFAQAIRTGKAPMQLPTFDTGLEVHHLIDTMRQSSEVGRILPVVLRGAQAVDTGMAAMAVANLRQAV